MFIKINWLKGLILLGCIWLQSFGNVQQSFAQSPTTNQPSQPLNNLLDQIGKKYGINILYEPNIVNQKTTTYRLPTNAPLIQVLNDLLSPLELNPAKIDEKNYAIINIAKQTAEEKTNPAKPTSTIVSPTENQTKPAPVSNSLKTITGRVLDNTTNEALAGASVTIKGLRIGMATTKMGEFSLNVPSDARTMVVDFIGYESVQQPISNNSNFTIRLKTKTASAGDVVVMGIISRQKESFTGATATFNAEQLKSVGNQNIIEGIRALDPSFILNENNLQGANPNVLPDIEIRGKTSVDSRALRDEFTSDPNQPLFILDGFETNLRTIIDLDMNRVESITLLKDAASTAIYGARAANGVVVVETRKPKPGTMQVFYNGDFRVEAPDLSVYNLMDAGEKLEFERLSGRYTIYSSTLHAQQMQLDQLYHSRLTRVRKGVDTYWLSEPVQTGYTQGHSLRAEGGDSRMRYGAGIQYRKQDGVMKGSGRDTWGGNVDLIYRAGKLNIMNKLFINGYNATESPYGSFINFANANPYYEKYNGDGGVDKYLEQSVGRTLATERIINPLYNAGLNNINETRNFAFQNNLQLTYTINNALQMQGGIQVNRASNTQTVFVPSEHTQFDNTTLFEKGLYRHRQFENAGYQANAMLVFGKLLGQKHQLNSNLRAEIQETSNEAYQTTVVGFPANSNGNPAYAFGYQPNARPVAVDNVFRRTNFLLSGSYTFDRRFVVDFSTRMDGSTAFGSNKKYQPFWSAGAGWNLHHEKMFANEKWLNTLRLKVNTGLTGNQNFGQITSVSIYNYLSSINTFGQGITLATLGNPDLEWQKTQQTNIGIDFSMFNNRFAGFVNAFTKYTNPLIVLVDLPASTGLSGFPTNVGNLTNNGIEANLRYAIINKPKERTMWTIGVTGIFQKATYSGLENQLENLNKQQQESRSLLRFRDGRSPDDLWSVKSLGIDPATGREIFLKLNSQYSFDYNTNDVQVVGNARPKAEGVISNTLNIKGFNFSFFLRYRIGGDVFNTALFNRVENISDANVMNNQDRRALTERWKNPGDLTQFKSISITATTPISSRFIQEENTLSGESISVGYDFAGHNWIKKMGMRTFNVRAYTNDVFRLSTVSRERGIDYPFSRSYSLSVNVSF